MPIPLDSLVATTSATLAVAPAWRRTSGGAVSGRPSVGTCAGCAGCRRARSPRRARRPDPPPAVGAPAGPARRRAGAAGRCSGRTAPFGAAAGRRPRGTGSTPRPRLPWSRPPSGSSRGAGPSSASCATDSADPDWFLDPVTGRRAPDRRFAFAINHRDEGETGNVKQVWEMSRHHHLTVLAAAWWLTGDDRYAEAVADQLRSWWRANPFLTGVHWTSGIEVGVRLLVLGVDPAAARRLAEGRRPVREQRRRRAADRAGTRSTWPRSPADGSSANNHVLAEAAGLLVARLRVPLVRRDRTRWRAERGGPARARARGATPSPSGINRELATDYHRFVLELAPGRRASRRTPPGTPLSASDLAALIGRMLDAAAAVARRRRRRPPRQGDGDEGRGLVVDDPELRPVGGRARRGCAACSAALDWWPARPGERRRRRSSGALGRTRHRPRPARRAGRDAVRRRRARSCCARRPATAPRSGAGATAVRTASSPSPRTPTPTRSRSRCGTTASTSSPTPARTATTASRSGGSGSARRAAHNTLELAGADQSESGGPFLWTDARPQRTLECRRRGRRRCSAGSASTTATAGFRSRRASPRRHARPGRAPADRRRLPRTAGQVPRPVVLAPRTGRRGGARRRDGAAQLDGRHSRAPRRARAAGRAALVGAPGRAGPAPRLVRARASDAGCRRRRSWEREPAPAARGFVTALIFA